MLQPKFETGIKRVITVTIIDEDVNRIDEILKTFEQSGHKDRRLMGFAKRFRAHIETQRQQIKLLEYQDRKEAAKEFFTQLELERQAEVEEAAERTLLEGDEILELTDAISPDDELPRIEDLTQKKN